MRMTKKFNPTRRIQIKGNCVICGKIACYSKVIYFHNGEKANIDLRLRCRKKTLEYIKEVHSKGMAIGFSLPYCSDECFNEILRRTQDYRA